MEFKLESGSKIKLKDVSIDERDEMLDSVEYQYDAKGNPKGMKMMNSTITKWLRLCVDGDTSDEFLKTLTLKDRTDIFVKMQEYLLVGEEKASK
jgi:hypothetical protein|tara:strand:+ start:1195 stop:1476 length:282 start_codon:yes stop_codon:yes gene_type:complete